MPHRYFLLHKPYDVLSQFVSPYPQRLLGDLGFDFPEGTHAIGRLDLHSEGLLLLTTNSKVTRLLF
ncbi:MAG: pseudouridine synthase, partial [Chitinophagaceae bacterium]